MYLGLTVTIYGGIFCNVKKWAYRINICAISLCETVKEIHSHCQLTLYPISIFWKILFTAFIPQRLAAPCFPFLDIFSNHI